MTALTGLRVIEMGGDVATAYCAKILAGFGAEVLRIDHAACARTGALAPDGPDAEEWLDTGKTRVTASDAEAVALCAGADVVLDGLGPNGLEAIGMDTTLSDQERTGRILVRIAPWGLHGPLAGSAASDITLYAASGLMQSTGRGDREPLNAGFPLVQLSAGLRACCAVLMALHRRALDGRGDVVEVSMQETGLDTYEIALMEHLRTGKVARRNGDEHALVPWRTFACRDGWAAIVGGPMRNWHKASALFEDPELSAPRLAHMADRIAHRQEVYERMRPWLSRTDKRDVFHRGQAAGQAWTYLATVEEAASDPQFLEREFFVPPATADERHARMPGAPFRPEKAPWRQLPAPDACQGADSVQGPPSPQWRGDAPAHAAPLEGVTVLDFTHDWAGPHAARLLADYGATVIKIEFPARLDGMRGAYKERINAHPRVHQLHRNKQSITLDLRLPEHRDACHRLVESADIVLDNSRPGVMARKGLAPETLQALNPKLVAVSLSAFGATGPYRAYAGYGGSIEAISGLQDLTAYHDDDERFRVREMDVLNGVFGAIAALLGLVHRHSSGHGQWVDLAETETTAWLVGEHFLRYFRHGVLPKPRGNADERFQLQGCFACSGEDQWITVTVATPDDTRQLRDLIGGSGSLQADLAHWCGAQDAATAETLLRKSGIAAAKVRSAADLVVDPHLIARRWWLAKDGVSYPGLPFHFARGGGGVRRRGPDLGADNASILPGIGLSPASWPDLQKSALGTAYDTEVDG